MSSPFCLSVYGTNHHHAGMAAREKIALSAEQVKELYEEIGQSRGVTECLVLNTCNRTEIYTVSSEGEPPSILRPMLSGVCGAAESDIREVEVFHEGRESVRHCLLVAAGLDSQMIGETEILGQVKQAYQESVERGGADRVLHRLFQHSFRVGKWVRTHTGLGRGQVSAATVAASLAGRIFGHLSGARILVVGTGKVGEATVKVLLSEGARQLAFTGRNAERVRAMAERHQAPMIEFGNWKAELSAFDIVMMSTRSEEWLLGSPDVEAALSRRRGRPQFYIDLAMPRDIHPDVGEVSDVYLYNLDDLAEIANENVEARQSEIERGRAYVAEQGAELWERLSEGVVQSAPSESPVSGKSGG